MSHLGKNLIFLRKQRQLKQNAMADLIDFNRTTWNGYENDYSVPTRKNLARISKFFNIPDHELMNVDLEEKQSKEQEKITGTGLVEDEAPQYSSFKSKIEELQTTIDLLTEHVLFQKEKIKKLEKENNSLKGKMKKQSAKK
jgi:transcriptional regulator with XRE-family HTH domain